MSGTPLCESEQLPRASSLCVLSVSRSELTGQSCSPLQEPKQERIFRFRMKKKKKIASINLWFWWLNWTHYLVTAGKPISQPGASLCALTTKRAGAYRFVYKPRITLSSPQRINSNSLLVCVASICHHMRFSA